MFIRCEKCQKETDPKYIIDLEEKLEAEIDDIEYMDIDGYRTLLEKYKPLLPATHYQMVIIKRYMFSIYGSQPGQEYVTGFFRNERISMVLEPF